MARRIVIECPACHRPHSPLLTMPIIYQNGMRFEMLFVCERASIRYWIDFVTFEVTRKEDM